MQGGRTPAWIATWRLDPALEQILGQPKQGSTRLQIADKYLLDNRAFTRFDLYSRWVSGAIGVQAIAIGRNGPGQKYPSSEFHLTPSSHALCN